MYYLRRKVPRCCTETRRTLRCLLIAIAICAIMNAATLVSIGYHISVRQESLIDVFNSSMRLYASAASYKYAIDEIQFIFQCCGHSSYTDWFLFDWQVNPPFKTGNSFNGTRAFERKYLCKDTMTYCFFFREWIMHPVKKWLCRMKYLMKNIGIEVYPSVVVV